VRYQAALHSAAPAGSPAAPLLHRGYNGAWVCPQAQWPKGRARVSLRPGIRRLRRAAESGARRNPATPSWALRAGIGSPLEANRRAAISSWLPVFVNPDAAAPNSAPFTLGFSATRTVYRLGRKYEIFAAVQWPSERQSHSLLRPALREYPCGRACAADSKSWPKSRALRPRNLGLGISGNMRHEPKASRAAMGSSPNSGLLNHCIAGGLPFGGSRAGGESNGWRER
jgi:hypothetical protein